MRVSLCAYDALLSALFLVFFVGSVRTQTAANQTVTAIDPRITYVGEWVQQDDGGHVFIGTTGSFALNFTGTAVYWYSRRLYDGAVAAVRLDDDDTVYIDLSAGTSENDTRTLTAEVLYEKEDLDGNQIHYLNISWNGPGGNGVGSYLENFRIQFTSTNSGSETSTTTSGSNPNSSSATSIPASNSSSTNVGAIVGGTVGGLAGALILILGLFCFWRRRARRADTEFIQSRKPFTFMTPFVSFRGPQNDSIISSHSTKPGEPGPLHRPGQQNSPLYTSSTATRPETLLSPDPARPAASLPLRSPNSRFTFLPSWYRPRSDSTSHLETSPVSPRDHHFFTRVPPSSSATRTLFPLSSGGSDIQEALTDPPPTYRR
ncbi:hypothetical protein ACEPAG_2406 [Sanghuangporus baumii]